MKTWTQTFYASDGSALKGADVYVYLADTTTSARVFDVNNDLHDSAPQLTTDITGYVSIGIDEDDYADDQLFDIKVVCRAACVDKDDVWYKSVNLFDQANLADAGNTANWSGVNDDNGNKPEDNADVTPQLPSDEGLMGYWSLDEGSGASARDSSVNGNDGTVSGNPTWPSGISGTCLAFDGSGDYVTIPNDSTLQIVGDLTISLWLKISAWPSSWQNLVSKIQDDTHAEFNLRLQDETTGQFYFGDGTSSPSLSWVPQDVITLGQWVHIVGVRKSQDYLKLYFDGELRYTNDSITTDAVTTTASVEFSHPYDLAASMDEVRIYNKVLTDSEIKALYLNPSGQKSPTPGATDNSGWEHPDDNTKLNALVSRGSWETKSADFTAVPYHQYRVQTNTKGSDLTMTLPASPSADDWIQWADDENSFGTYNLLILRNGNTIENQDYDVRCDRNGDHGQLEYTGSTWIFTSGA